MFVKPCSMVCVVFLSMGFIIQSRQQDYATDNMMVGIKYRNYTNYEGRLADGTCCDADIEDECPPDDCDTSFLTCANYAGESDCEAFFTSSTPTTYGVNSIIFNDTIGNQDASSSTLFVYIPGITEEDIFFTIYAEEEPDGKLIAEFTFVIDWMETSYNDEPDWHQLLLKEPQAELGLDVFRQCYQGYFGSTCDIYCIETEQYTCASDGSRLCKEGWQGCNCSEKTPKASDNDDDDSLVVILSAVIAVLALGLLVLTGLVCLLVWKNTQLSRSISRFRAPSTNSQASLYSIHPASSIVSNTTYAQPDIQAAYYVPQTPLITYRQTGNYSSVEEIAREVSGPL